MQSENASVKIVHDGLGRVPFFIRRERECQSPALKRALGDEPSFDRCFYITSDVRCDVIYGGKSYELCPKCLADLEGENEDTPEPDGRADENELMSIAKQ